MKYTSSVLSLALQALSLRQISARSQNLYSYSAFIPSHCSRAPFSTKIFSTEQKSSDEADSTYDTSKSPSAPESDVLPPKGGINKTAEITYDTSKSPWAPENNVLPPKGGLNKTRFRQHVNPLARKYQMETELNKEWPNDGTFTDPSLPLHIDVGCGKGGFLLELAKLRQDTPNESEGERNYLGLEIRPSVATFAKERVGRRGLAGKLDFIGCNANVDLDRILESYTKFGEISLVSIQYPDPHFKKSHQKRRVVTPKFIYTLAKYVKEGKEIFIQSDIKDVLDSMRETIREFGSEYFTDIIDDMDEYMEGNPTGVPTEREVSVLDQDLPVYRTIFRRTEIEWTA